MYISFFALHLGFGGVEKYVTKIANMLAEEHDVEIISTYKLGDTPAFPIDKRVKVRYLTRVIPNQAQIKQCLRERKCFRFLYQILYAIRVVLLKNIFNITAAANCQSDVVISTRIFHNQILGKFLRKRTVKIATEHNYHNHDRKYFNKVVRSCKKFDYFIPISKTLCNDYREVMKKNGVRTVELPFCVDDHKDNAISSYSNNDLVIVGRVSPEKNFIDAVRVFDLVSGKIPDSRLHIVGEGEELDMIKCEAKKRGLWKRVLFHGFLEKRKVFELLSKCSLYLMTSRTESFGIVLLEAMSCGLPCVAFDSANGAKEIIRNGYNGFLIANREICAMAETICEVLEKRETLYRLGKGALSTAEKYSESQTKAGWQSLMKEIENEMCFLDIC